MRKKTTKERILFEALKQFNKEGLGKVTIRSIADQLDMSAGNLSYHYKNTDFIIYELYLELVAAIDQTIFELHTNDLDLHLLYDLLLTNQRKMFTYRFVLLEFASIARRVEAVRRHFRQLIRTRQQQFQFFLGQLIEAGYLKKEVDEHVQLELIYRSFIFSNAWIPDAYIHFEQPDERVIPFYARLQMGILLPFLTSQGKAQYEELMNKHYPESFLGYPE